MRFRVVPVRAPRPRLRDGASADRAQPAARLAAPSLSCATSARATRSLHRMRADRLRAAAATSGASTLRRRDADTTAVDDLEASRRRIEELERELRETRERSSAFTRIAESIDHHVYINEVLPGGGRRTLFAGPGRDRLLGGVPADGDWGRAWIEAVHPDDRALYAEHTARYLRGEMSEVRCRLIGLDGVTRWIVGGGDAPQGGRPPDHRGHRARCDGRGDCRGAPARGRAHRRPDGLFNRRHFSEVLEAELERSRRSSVTPGLLVIDVDHFKSRQRHLRPPGRRRGADRDRGAAAQRRAQLRHRGALGRRGVHRARSRPRGRAVAAAICETLRAQRERDDDRGRRAHARGHRLDRRRARAIRRARTRRSSTGRPRAVRRQAPRAQLHEALRRAHRARSRRGGARGDPPRPGALALGRRARRRVRAARRGGRRACPARSPAASRCPTT